MEEISPKDLALIVSLAKKQQELELQVEETEELLKTKKEELAHIQGGWDEGKEIEGALPKAMEALGVDQIKLTDGTKISIDDELKPPSLAKDAPNREVVLNWLDETGHADIIKDTIIIYIQKENQVLMKEVMEFLTKLKLEYERYRSAHWMTFRKLLSEMMAGGEVVPMVELGVQKFKKSKLK